MISYMVAEERRKDIVREMSGPRSRRGRSDGRIVRQADRATSGVSRLWALARRALRAGQALPLGSFGPHAGEGVSR